MFSILSSKQVSVSQHLQIPVWPVHRRFRNGVEHGSHTPRALTHDRRRAHAGGGCGRTRAPPRGRGLVPAALGPAALSMIRRAACCHRRSDGRRRRGRPRRGVWFRFVPGELVLTVDMGVPKFYRWISERYPCLSEVVKEHQVGERGAAAPQARTRRPAARSPGDGALQPPLPARRCRLVAGRGARKVADAR